MAETASGGIVAYAKSLLEAADWNLENAEIVLAKRACDRAFEGGVSLPEVMAKTLLAHKAMIRLENEHALGISLDRAENRGQRRNPLEGLSVSDIARGRANRW